MIPGINPIRTAMNQAPKSKRSLVEKTTQFGVSLINHTLEKQYTINEAKQLFVLNAFYAVVAVLLPILYV